MDGIQALILHNTCTDFKTSLQRPLLGESGLVFVLLVLLHKAPRNSL